MTLHFETDRDLPISSLRGFLADLFVATGLPSEAAQQVTEALLEADQQGIPSHGIAQAPMYLQRLRIGSVSTADRAKLIADNTAVIVLDAGHMLGHLAADQAMTLAVEKAAIYGLGLVTVRHAFHFGVAGRYAERATHNDCIGIAMCNTKPMMPAPGGHESLLGNNPLAVAAPANEPPAVVLDMATSEAALGRIRAASMRGDSIPSTWGLKSDGSPTTNPNEVIEGMLLPLGGAKGFGLALMIDILCGGLSSGSWGSAVKPLYGDLWVPNDCSSLFVAIHIPHFRSINEFRREIGKMRKRIVESSTLPGMQPRVPGQRGWQCQQQHKEKISVDWKVIESLVKISNELGVQPPEGIARRLVS